MTARPEPTHGYTFDAPIGEGGMGVVWAARASDGRAVAIKLVRASATGADGSRRLLREARAASAIVHPNVVRVLEVIELDGAPAIVLELLEGESLARRLDRDGALAPEVARPILAAVAEGAGAAHALGIIHRDLKPENVFLCRDGCVKILDFGIAKLTAVDGDAARTAETATGELLGTPSYMAPEQIFGEADLDGRVDVWALGLIAYRCLAGVLPTHSANVGQALKRILTGTIPPLREVAPDVPLALAALVDRMVARDRDARPASMREVASALLAEPPAIALAATVASPAPPHRRQWPAVAGIVAALALAGAGGVWALRGHGGPSAAERAARAARSIAVVGFADRTGRADQAWLATAFTEMLGTELAAGSRLRVVPPEAVAQMKTELGLSGSDALGSAAFAGLRDSLGTDLVVTGAYSALANGHVRLEVRVVVASTGETVVETSDEAGAGDRFDMIARLGTKLRRALGIDAATAADLGAARSSLPADPEAARLYVAGLERLRAYDVLGARAAFEKAVAASPDDPLPHAQLAEALTELGYDTEAAAEAKRAFDHAGGLRREARLLVEARYRISTKEWDRAIDAYRTLADFHPGDLQTGLALAEAQRTAGRPKDVLATVAELRKLQPPAGDDPRLDLEECAAHDDQGDYKALVPIAERAFAKGQARGARRIMARALHFESWALENIGDASQALAKARESRRRFDALGDHGGAGLALNTIGGSSTFLGDYAGAIAAYRDLATESHLLGNPTYEAAAATNTMIALFEQGDLAGVAASIEPALQLARAASSEELVAADETVDGMRLALQGRFTDSAQRFDDALALGRKTDNQRALAWADCLDGERLLAMGDRPAARATIQASLDARARLGLEGFVAESKVALARVEIDDGHPDRAVPLARAAQQAFADQKEDYNEALAASVLADALIAQAKLDDAAPLVAHALEIAGHGQRAYIRFAATLADAALRAARHDAAGARAELQTIVVDAKRLGFGEAELEARLALARVDGDRASVAVVAREARIRGFGRVARLAAAR